MSKRKRISNPAQVSSRMQIIQRYQLADKFVQTLKELPPGYGLNKIQVDGKTLYAFSFTPHENYYEEASDRPVYVLAENDCPFTALKDGVKAAIRNAADAAEENKEATHGVD